MKQNEIRIILLKNVIITVEKVWLVEIFICAKVNIDCDHDTLVYQVIVMETDIACHLQRPTCFCNGPKLKLLSWG